MKTLPYLALLLSLSAHAQKAKVLIVDPKIDPKSLEKDFEVEKPSNINTLPSRKDRDLILNKLPEASSWDELQKDIFYMDLKNKKLSDIAKKYPNISSKTLEDLKKTIK